MANARLGAREPRRGVSRGTRGEHRGGVVDDSSERPLSRVSACGEFSPSIGQLSNRSPDAPRRTSGAPVVSHHIIIGVNFSHIATIQICLKYVT